MKYLKYLFGIIAFLGLVFFGKGIISPAVSYDSEITVNKPVKEAWAVMTDESKISDWLKPIKSVKHIKGEKNSIGAVTKYVMVENGQEMEMLETMTAIEPNEYVAMTFTMDMMDMDYEMHFSEKDGKTFIQSKTITEGKGWLMKPMVSFMGSTMKTQEDENLDNLKKVIEENTTNYFPEPVVEVQQ